MFDLSKKPIYRESFAFGGDIQTKSGYLINDKCIGCGMCLEKCPTNCINAGTPFFITQENCLHCGNCFEICPARAVEKR